MKSLKNWSVKYEQRKTKDLIFTAQCSIGEYIATTLDDDLLDKACDLLEEALKELKD